MIENLKFNYKVYKKVKDFPNILTPMDYDIRKMGMHWDSHRLRLIDKHKKTIKKVLKGKLELESLEKEINDNSFFKTITQKKVKSIEEIESCYESNLESEKVKKKIMKLLNKGLLDDDLREIDYTIKKKLYKI